MKALKILLAVALLSGSAHAIERDNNTALGATLLPNTVAAATITVNGTGNACFSAGGLVIDCNTKAATFIATSSVTISSNASIGSLAVTYGVTAATATVSTVTITADIIMPLQSGGGTTGPSLSWSGDTTTGLYSNAAGNIQTTISGQSSLTNDQNGITVRGQNNNPAGPNISIRNTGTGFHSTGAGNITFDVSSSSKMVLNATGLGLGLGPIGPATLLHMSSGTLTIDGNTAAFTSSGSITGTGPNGNVISASSITTTAGLFGGSAVVTNSSTTYSVYAGSASIGNTFTNSTVADSMRVFSSIAGAGAPGLFWGPNSNTNGGRLSYDSNTGDIYVDDLNSGGAAINFRTKVLGTAVTPLKINGNASVEFASNTVTLDGSGYQMIIGAPASPAGLLHVAGVNPIINEDQAANNVNASIYDFRKSRGTLASKTIVANADNIADIIGYGYDGSIYQNSAMIRYGVDAVPGANLMPGNISFWTTPQSASLSQRMVITSTGNVGIGTTAPGSLFEVAGGSVTFTASTTKLGLRLNSPAETRLDLYSNSSNGSSRNWAIATGYQAVGDFAISESLANGTSDPEAGNTIKFYISQAGNVGIGSSALISTATLNVVGTVSISSAVNVGTFVSTQAAGGAGASVTALCQTVGVPAGTSFAQSGGCSCSGAVAETANISTPNCATTGCMATGWTCQVSGGTGGACSAYAVCNRIQ